MRPFVRVKMLNADEYRVLKKTVASRKLPAGKVRRAKIILSSNQGHTAREIAEELDCNERTVLRWINRFNRYGVAGREEGPRSPKRGKAAPGLPLEKSRSRVPQPRRQADERRQPLPSGV